MARSRPKTCKLCRQHGSGENPISRNGKCRECGERRHEENTLQILAREGPYFEKWASGLVVAGQRFRATEGNTP